MVLGLITAGVIGAGSALLGGALGGGGEKREEVETRGDVVTTETTTSITEIDASSRTIDRSVSPIITLGSPGATVTSKKEQLSSPRVGVETEQTPTLEASESEVREEASGIKSIGANARTVAIAGGIIFGAYLLLKD